MFKCVLTVKVCNAANRDDDHHYRKSVELVLPPLPGTTIVVCDTKINSKVKPKEFTVRTFKQYTDSEKEVLVVLDQDNSTFKHPTLFNSICKRLEELGFHLEPSDTPARTRSKRSTTSTAE